MIVDCFTFFNELDLLEIRLNVLSGVVDRFVLVEADRTFTGQPKPLHFAEHQDRFLPFLDRIEHVVVTDMPPPAGDYQSAWRAETHQRNAIMRGLEGVPVDAMVMVSDVDEIPDPEKVADLARHPILHVFNQTFYYYFLDCQNATIRWNGTRMLPRHRLVQPQAMRHSSGNVVLDGGWHFSYLGGVAAIQKKIESFSHSEYNTDYYKNPEKLLADVLAGRDLFDRADHRYQFVPVDETYPTYLREHLDRYRHLLRPQD